MELRTYTNLTESRTPYMLPLTALKRGDISLAGGKGANLGELTNAGFPVPDGFVLTTAAYDRFVEQGRLEDIIARALKGEPTNGAAIRAALESSPIPAEIERNILESYHQLGEGPVAVRSSATAEDLPEAAFAGQQDTLLNVAGERLLLDAVRHCWASLWTDRAISYRKRQGLDQAAVKLAVVVQCMVAADIAGVMFTANPVTGERDEIVIDASPGLGEAVVSGLVTPDHYLLRKGRRGSYRLASHSAGRNEVIVRARSGGGTEHIEGTAVAGAPTLPSHVLQQLARLGVRIQGHFASPQDIEWAWAGGKLFILQARPITALPEPPPHPGKPVQMLAAIFTEMFPIRPYPLDQTTWISSVSTAAVEPIFSLIGIDVPPLGEIFHVEDGIVIQFSGKLSFLPTPRILLAPVRLLLLALRYNPVHWRLDPLLLEAIARARTLEARNLHDSSWEELLSIICDALALAMPLAGEIRRRYYPRAVLAAALLQVTLVLMRRGNRLGALLSGTQSLTSEANRLLEDLAGRVRSDPDLSVIFANHSPGELRSALQATPAGRSFLNELHTFLDRYGHREVILSTALQPTWKDAPEAVLGIVKGLASTGTRREAARAEWETTRDELLAIPLMKIPFLRSTFLRLLEAARCLWQVRESSHYEATRILPVLRRTELELGRRLVAVGVLDGPEDVFHLKLDELERVNGNWPPLPELAGEMRAAVLRRKERRAELENIPLVDPRLYHQNETQEGLQGVLLRGTPGSPGIAEGPVRIIKDISEFDRLQAGEVLVAPYTNPTWTPLFQRAIAVVVDGGAAGSHAAIVAREYGIPAVMGTTEGTRSLVDGQMVRVDGTRGLVFDQASREQ